MKIETKQRGKYAYFFQLRNVKEQFGETYIRKYNCNKFISLIEEQ